MNTNLKIIVLSIMFMGNILTINAISPQDANRIQIIRYGINPRDEVFKGVKNPVISKNEEAMKGTGFFIDTDEGMYEVTYNDESLIQWVVSNRLELRGSLHNSKLPIKVGNGMTMQCAYYSDEDATLNYVYICDETVHDIGGLIQFDLAWSIIKDRLKNPESRPLLEKVVNSVSNIRYIYVGNKTGLTHTRLFGWYELSKLLDEIDK